MKTLKTLFAVGVLLFAFPTLAAANARPPAPPGCEPSEVFLNLSSDEVWRSNMALNFAKGFLMDGSPVTVFLNVRGVRVAVKEHKYLHDTYALTGKTNLEVLEEIVDLGGRVIVCPNCLQRSGFKPRELIKGVYLGGPVRDILQCSSVQVSY